MLTHRDPTEQAPSRVVVLGLHGFVASRLIRLLQSGGTACRPVGSREVDLIEPSASEKLRDILQPDDAVVITSALTPEKGRDRTTFLKNVAMIENVCASLEKAPCAHVVYVSSDSVYQSHCAELNEQTCAETDDLYGLSHIVREKLLAETCHGKNIALAIVRPSGIYGAGDTHDSYGPNRFMRSARTEEKITLLGQGEEERDHVYIDDVTRILRECLFHFSSGVINAVSGTAVTFHEVARKIIAAIGAPIRIEMAPRRVPIVHKRFDTTALFQAFPDLSPTTLEAGIHQSLAGLAGVDARLASRGSAQ
jgi:UDP-glucose 4-epimerase